jgi:ABC-type glycerol-3-phosphate transport system substrate-binding protein
MQRVFALVLATCLMLCLAACSLLAGELPDSTTETAVTATVTTTPTQTPPPAITPDIAISDPISQTKNTLIVWIPPEIWAATEAGQSTLNAQLNSYRASHPELEIRVEPKAVTGQGSILNYLRTGRTIAPTILPDLIALPTDQLAQATADGLIFPLNDYLDPVQLEDVYPAGLELVTLDGQTSGYPFVLSQPPHLAYDSAIFTATVPLTWTQWLALPREHFVFPAAGAPGTTLLLQLYLDNGGQLTNEAGQVALQPEPLAAALQQILDGRKNGFILPQSSDLLTLEESWQLFKGGQATFVQTTDSQYLRQRNGEQLLNTAAIPGRERPLPPLVTGWAWAISALDAARRPLAADLLTFLVENKNLGEWSYQSQQLPARPAAFPYWPEDDPYVPFISDQLLQAAAHPFTPNHPVMMALSNALFDVISQVKSPQEAAEQAIATLQQ